MTALEELRKLYFNAKRGTIKKDIVRAMGSLFDRTIGPGGTKAPR